VCVVHQLERVRQQLAAARSRSSTPGRPGVEEGHQGQQQHWQPAQPDQRPGAPLRGTSLRGAALPVLPASPAQDRYGPNASSDPVPATGKPSAWPSLKQRAMPAPGDRGVSSAEGEEKASRLPPALSGTASHAKCALCVLCPNPDDARRPLNELFVMRCLQVTPGTRTLVAMSCHVTSAPPRTGRPIAQPWRRGWGGGPASRCPTPSAHRSQHPVTMPGGTSWDTHTHTVSPAACRRRPYPPAALHDPSRPPVDQGAAAAGWRVAVTSRIPTLTCPAGYLCSTRGL
jgi:hypothetical protein